MFCNRLFLHTSAARAGKGLEETKKPTGNAFYWWRSISLFWSKPCYLAVLRARPTRFASGAWDDLGFWTRRLVPVLL